MTARENLMSIFRHERPEWIPVTGQRDGHNQPSKEGMDPQLAEKMKNVQWCDESTVAFSRHLGIDIVDFQGAPIRSMRRNVTIEWATEGADTITTWHTPKGDLREVRRQCRDDGTSYTMEHLVKGPDDLPLLSAIFEDEQFEIDPDGQERIRKRKELIGDGGMLMFFMAGTPLGMMYRVYSGVETLAYRADARKALWDLFEVMERNYAQQFRLACQSEADILVTMDDTSTTAILPRMFEEFHLGYTDRLVDITHAAGKIYFHPTLVRTDPAICCLSIGRRKWTRSMRSRLRRSAMSPSRRASACSATGSPSVPACRSSPM